jgi:hypothetical protein
MGAASDYSRAMENIMTNKAKNARRLHYVQLHGGKCVKCGSVERLEFDHINPATKIEHRIWSWSKPRLEAELAKCQLLCQSCHIEKTKAEFVYTESMRPVRLPIPHGTWAGYAHYKCRCHECRSAANAHDRARYYSDTQAIENEKVKLATIRENQIAFLFLLFLQKRPDLIAQNFSL